MRDRSSIPGPVFSIMAAIGVVIGAGTPLAQAQLTPELLRQFRGDEFKSPDGDAIPYRMLTPPKVEDGQRYPLVLFLHGAGERGNDNQSQLVHGAADFASEERKNAYPSFVVFPQCPAGQRWVESAWGLPSGRNEFDVAPSKPMSLTLQLVDSLLRDCRLIQIAFTWPGYPWGGRARGSLRLASLVGSLPCWRCVVVAIHHGPRSTRGFRSGLCTAKRTRSYPSREPGK